MLSRTSAVFQNAGSCWSREDTVAWHDPGVQMKTHVVAHLSAQLVHSAFVVAPTRWQVVQAGRQAAKA